jgi:flagellar FliL protein
VNLTKLVAGGEGSGGEGGGGGAAVMMMKKKAAAEAEAEAEAEDGGEGKAPAKAVAKQDPKAVPVFVPLEPFTVNLADRDAERYAQVGITLEVEDAKVGDQIKAYMPAIRNNILLALSDRTAADLMDRDGKAKLAERVRQETSRALGYEVVAATPQANGEDKPGKGDGNGDGKVKGKKKKTAEPPALPVKAVHFSNFIIQ